MPNSDIYKRIWRWRGPERYKVHLWKISQNALVTNLFRFSRGISSSSGCPMCGSGEESMLHLLRDCVVAKQVWSIISPNLVPSFFTATDLTGWLDSNLKDIGQVRGG